MKNFVITIARGFGSGGKTIGRLLAQRLDIDYYDNDLIRLASEESGINIELFGKADERVKTNLFKKYSGSYGEDVIPPDSDEFVSNDNLFNYQAKIIRSLAEKQNCIIIGRCGDYILKNHPNTLRLYVYADHATCIENVMDIYGVSPKQAAKRIEEIDKARANYYKYYTGGTWSDVSNYDLCINTTDIGFEKSVDVILAYMRTLGYEV